MAAGAEGRNRDHGNAGAIAEEVERLDVARVPISAGFVPGDENGGFSPQLRIGVERRQNVENVAFEQINLRALRVTVEQTVRFPNDTDGRSLF